MPWRFLHGVASGDPLPDAIVLWTRVTPNGTSAARALVVRWQIWEGDLERSDGLEAPLLQRWFIDIPTPPGSRLHFWCGESMGDSDS